jgi:hypothetical protein
MERKKKSAMLPDAKSSFTTVRATPQSYSSSAWFTLDRGISHCLAVEQACVVFPGTLCLKKLLMSLRTCLNIKEEGA